MKTSSYTVYITMHLAIGICITMYTYLVFLHGLCFVAAILVVASAVAVVAVAVAAVPAVVAVVVVAVSVVAGLDM